MDIKRRTQVALAILLLITLINLSFSHPLENKVEEFIDVKNVAECPDPGGMAKNQRNIPPRPPAASRIPRTMIRGSGADEGFFKQGKTTVVSVWKRFVGECF